MWLFSAFLIKIEWKQLYLLFLLHFLQFPVLPVLSRTSPPKILSLSMLALGPSSSALPHILQPIPPMYFLFLPYFQVCPALPLPKSCWACPLQVPPAEYFPILWILPWFSSIVSVMRFSSPSVLLEFSWKIYLD